MYTGKDKRTAAVDASGLESSAAVDNRWQKDQFPVMDGMPVKVMFVAGWIQILRMASTLT